MVDGIGGARVTPDAADAGDAAGSVDAAGGTEPAPAAGRTRREVTRRLLASAAVAAAAPLVAASRPPRPAAGPWDAPDRTAFEETYRGRRIEGVWTPEREHGATGAGQWYVTVDGRPLHLMRRADGTWLSMVDHYGSYRTPLEAARGAVDEMGPGRRLRDLAPGPLGAPHPHRGGEPGGVHA
ncbi:tyrosinase family oxidase copper chaperone [Streptomyces sp. NPDC047017]|uniref:tyrosinase family oxidase copper chaperone n=1 Tax=Streptomyces sp. NPDC047017 TaxID=3155024 RepID=UPI0034096D20